MKWIALKRWCVGLIPLIGFILGICLLKQHTISLLWQLTLTITLLLYLACALIPKTVRLLQSMPYTYNLNNNWGTSGLEAQLITYVGYHTHWYNHITHAAFPLEALLWLMVIYSYFYITFNAAIAFFVLVTLCILLVIQAYSFKDKPLIKVLSGWWVLLSLITLILTSLMTPGEAYCWSVILLLSLGCWRFTGHWVEPVPPALVNNAYFISIRDAKPKYKLLGAFLLGFFSEFAAGLPFRLVNIWIYVGLQQRFPQASFHFSWKEAKSYRKALHEQGWHVHPRTKKLIEGAPY